jgi:hypothetical protein
MSGMRVNSGLKPFPKLQVLKLLSSSSLFSLLQEHAWEGKIGKIGGEEEEDKSGKGFWEGVQGVEEEEEKIK